jgi:transcriptional regulator with XRE-family HTH domain
MERNIYKHIGATIKNIRQTLGITQEELSYKAKISPGFLSHIERGTKKASIETIQRISDALGVPIHKIFEKAIPIIENKKESYTYLKRLEMLVKDKGDEYKKTLLKIAKLLDMKDK